MKLRPVALFPCLAVLTLVAMTACSTPDERKQRYLNRGEALAAEGKHLDAILEYKNAIKIDPRFGEARYRLAEAYARTDGPREAIKEFVRAADLLPDRGDVQMRAAQVLLAAQQYEAVRKYAEAALAVDAKNVDAQIILANSLAGLKDPDGAVRELEAAMQIAPDDSRPYTTLGAVRAAQGDPAAAETAFKKAVEMSPRSAPAKLALAYFYLTLRRLPEAEDLLLKIVTVEPKNGAANRLLAIFYLGQQRLTDAEQPLGRLVEVEDLASTLTLADLYVRTNRPEKARPLYEHLKAEKASRSLAVARLASLDYRDNNRADAFRAVDEQLKEDPANSELLTLKANWMLNERRLDEAQETARKAVTANARSASAHHALGRVQLARGEHDEAIKSFNEALKLNPQLTLASVELSRLLLARGDSDQALQHAMDARKRDPRNPDARLGVARAFLGKRELVAADTEIRALLADFPKVAAVHTLHANLLMLKGDGNGAVAAFDRALELRPSDRGALAGRLGADLRVNRPEEGRARLARAIESAPADADLHIIAARFENTAGDAAAAERHLRKAIEVDPGNFDAFSLLGRLYFRQNRLDEARRGFENAAKQRPNAVGSRTMVAIIFESQGRPDEARKVYEEILSSLPRAAVAANNLAWLYATRGEQLDRALQLAQDAKQQLPDRAEVNDTLGWIYYLKDMPSLAIKPLELSVQKDPKNASYQLHLGLAYAKAGQADKARAALEAALSLNPNVENAQVARTTLATLKS